MGGKLHSNEGADGVAHPKPACTAAALAAPGFAVFEAWAPRTSIQNVFLEIIRCAAPWCQQYRFPSVENRDGWGSQSAMAHAALC